MACAKLGERLFQARKAARLGMLALAKRSGVSSTTINDIEKGRQLPAADTIERLAQALSIKPCWLAFGDGPLREESLVAPRDSQSRPADRAESAVKRGTEAGPK